MNHQTAEKARPRPAAFHDFAPKTEAFLDAVIDGLSNLPKRLPCKFFYDRRGSQLFDEICELEEYYPTRTEIALLESRAADIAGFAGPGCHLIELGSGSSMKVRILLDRLVNPAAYTAVDISGDHLLAAASEVAHDYPDIEVLAVSADYTVPFPMPRPLSAPDAKRVAFFPGSTIGNFTQEKAAAFLANVIELIDHEGDLLIGVDLKKSPAILNAAYNDSRGVTAAFNLNILERINNELGADIDVAAFAHRAFYNPDRGRVEMHLVSTVAQDVHIDGRTFHFDQGESIHTENSHKYAIEEFQDLARGAGFSPLAVWTDANELFSIHYMRVG